MNGDFVISQPGFPESVEIRQAGMEREGYGGVTGWDRADHWGLLSSVATSSWPVLALWMSAE